MGSLTCLCTFPPACDLGLPRQGESAELSAEDTRLNDVPSNDGDAAISAKTKLTETLDKHANACTKLVRTNDIPKRNMRIMSPINGPLKHVSASRTGKVNEAQRWNTERIFGRSFSDDVVNLQVSSLISAYLSLGFSLISDSCLAITSAR